MTEASHQMTSNPLPKHGPHKPGEAGFLGLLTICLHCALSSQSLLALPLLSALLHQQLQAMDSLISVDMTK